MITSCSRPKSISCIRAATNMCSSPNLLNPSLQPQISKLAPAMPRSISLYCQCARMPVASIEGPNAFLRLFSAAVSAIPAKPAQCLRRPRSNFGPTALENKTTSKRVMEYKRDLRPAQQEEEAGPAQGKLSRQLRTGRALLALGLRGGRAPAQAAVRHGIL